MTVTVFDGLANYAGVQKGWLAKVVKDKFNITLNLVAPNVAGGGSTLFNTRSAAGNLGDIIIYGYGQGNAAKMKKAGLIADMTPYLSAIKGTDYIKQYSGASQALNKLSGIGGTDVWGIPGSVSSLSPTAPSEGNDPTFGPFVRWDLYKAVGYPKLSTLDDLIPVLKKMQDKARQETGNQKIYAIELFKDWDGGSFMNNAKQPTDFYGYDQVNTTVLAKADGSDYQSLLQKGGQYEQALKFFFKANQAGLVDPDSTSQNYDTMYAKYQNGQALFSFWPWLGQAAYNTTSNLAAGKGFEIAPVQDLKVFSYGAQPNGYTQAAIYLGSKAKNKSRLVKFINWLYSPEGVYDTGAQTGGTAGPKGLTWTVKDGQPTLTDFGKKVLFGGGGTVPASWGGGTYKDGVSALNFPSVVPATPDPATGQPFNASMWPTTLKWANNNPVFKDWQAHMGDPASTMDYLQKNNLLLVSPGATWVPAQDPMGLDTQRQQVGQQIVAASWKAAFADSESQFDSILADATKTANGLGMKDVVAFDMAQAKSQEKAREAVVAQYKDK